MEVRRAGWVVWTGGSLGGDGSYHGGGGSVGSWYEDDGVTRDYTTSDAFATSTLKYELSPLRELNATVVTSGAGYAGEPAARTHALQLRGTATAGAPALASCRISGSGKTTALARSESRSWSSPGWWVQDQETAEMAVPGGSVVVVCPPTKKSDTLKINVKWPTADSKSNSG